MSKKLNKYFEAFDYFDKIFIVLSAKSREISIIYFISIIGVPAGIASFYSCIFFDNKNNKEIIRNKKK